jgi:hypothetical protein
MADQLQVIDLIINSVLNAGIYFQHHENLYTTYQEWHAAMKISEQTRKV